MPTITAPGSPSSGELRPTFCDPYFGFCYPAVVTANQVVASFSTYKGGFNAGGGSSIASAIMARKISTEARCQEIFTTSG